MIDRSEDWLVDEVVLERSSAIGTSSSSEVLAATGTIGPAGAFEDEAPAIHTLFESWGAFGGATYLFRTA